MFKSPKQETLSPRRPVTVASNHFLLVSHAVSLPRTDDDDDDDDDDDVYYYIGERLKLEGETENSGV